MKKKRCADFVVKEQNAVVAVYVVAPDLVAAEPEEMKGVPFIFYRGEPGRSTQRAMVAHMEHEKGVHYGTDGDIICILAHGSQGPTPKEMEEYIPTAWNGTPLVPYSFGIHHGEDEKLERRVRSYENFRDFFQIFARVRENREREERPIRFFMKRFFASTV
ncbi:MAG: hypothetical protein AAB652_00755 [Patescibacteria group bacterium]